jgi:hypothetical protein
MQAMSAAIADPPKSMIKNRLSSICCRSMKIVRFDYYNFAKSFAKLRNLASARPAKTEKIVEIFVQKNVPKPLHGVWNFSNIAN